MYCLLTRLTRLTYLSFVDFISRIFAYFKLRQIFESRLSHCESELKVDPKLLRWWQGDVENCLPLVCTIWHHHYFNQIWVQSVRMMPTLLYDQCIEIQYLSLKRPTERIIRQLSYKALQLNNAYFIYCFIVFPNKL